MVAFILITLTFTFGLAAILTWRERRNTWSTKDVEEEFMRKNKLGKWFDG